MKVKIMIADVLDTILDETKTDIVVQKNGVNYIGALFYKQDEDHAVRNVLYSEDFEGDAFHIMLKAYFVMKEYHLIKGDDMTLKTMLHWQYLNGLTDEFIDFGYWFKTDTELLGRLSEKERTKV